MQAPSSTAAPDEEGQRYLDVQRHAAAVQLLGRSLAVAHLRAQLAMPRGGTLHIPKRPAALIKQEDAPGLAAPQQQQQQRRHGLAAAAQHASLQQQAIKVTLLTTSEDLPQQQAAAQPQQQQQQHAKAAASLKPRQLVHRLPDAAAAARFKSDELPESDAAAAAAGDGDSNGLLMDVDAAPTSMEEQQQQQQLAPRMVADPGQASQQLAGWVRVAGEGGEADGLPGQQQQFDEAEGLLGQGAAEADDMLDEEEWV